MDVSKLEYIFSQKTADEWWQKKSELRKSFLKRLYKSLEETQIKTLVRKSLEISFKYTEGTFCIQDNFNEKMEKAAIPLFREEIAEIVIGILDSELDEFKLVMSQYFDKSQIKDLSSPLKPELKRTTGGKALEIFAFLTIVPGLFYLVYQSLSWSYDEALDQIADQIAKNFCKGFYFKVIYDMTSQYDDSVAKLESANHFSKTNQEFIEEEKQEQIEKKKLQQVETRINEIDDILESNSVEENFDFSDANIGSQVSMVSDQISKKNSHEPQ